MLNRSQKSGMQVIFQTVDQSLSRAVEFLDSMQERSPFDDLAADATPIQKKVVADYVSRIRGLMRAALESYQIPLAREKRSSVWSAHMAVLAATITLEDLHPERLRGYGAIDPDDAEILVRIKTQLDQQLEKIQAYLVQPNGADLQQRLSRLDLVGPEIRLLKSLEQIITRRGLVEFRGTLATLLDRIESKGLEVAVFGRVSSGKSSLVNYIVEADVLPVGVTPVTAIPTRIVYGTAPRAIVEFADAKPFVTFPSDVAQFACEQLNPGNSKHISKIHVELPARRLREGITLVDTPGVGSLALSGAAEAMAYLPRCDLGVVLVDSASTLVAQDVALVDLLVRAGALVQVLLSKADTLSEDEIKRAVTYVRRQLRVQTQLDVPVYAISVRGDKSTLCDNWLSGSLAPAFEHHRELAEVSLRRKTALLRDAVAASLREALARTDNASSAAWQPASNVLLQAASLLETTIRHFDESMTSAKDMTEHVLNVATERLTSLWATDPSHTPRADDELVHALNEVGQEMAMERVRTVMDMERTLRNVLEQAADASRIGSADCSLTPPSNLPILSFDQSHVHATLKRTWRQLLGPRSVSRDVRGQLESAVGQGVEQILYRHGRALNDWCSQSLRELAHDFTTRADFFRASPSQGAHDPLGTTDEIVADLAKLEPDEAEAFDHSTEARLSATVGAR